MSKLPNTKHDFLFEAAGFYLSEFPESWSGEKIATYLENKPEDYDSKITAWLPFEGYCGEELASHIRDLARSFQDHYERGINDARKS